MVGGRFDTACAATIRARIVAELRGLPADCYGPEVIRNASSEPWMTRLRAWSAGVAMVAAGCGGDSGASPGTETSAGSGSTGVPAGTSTTTTAADTTSSSGAESTSGAVDETATIECENDGACTDPSAPICVMGHCAGCADAPADACGQRDPATPLCLPSGGCGQCSADDDSACADATPVCDLGTNACVGCTRNDQCPGTACDAAIGSCFADDCVIRVAGDGSGDFMDIGSAVAAIAPDDSCVVTIASADSSYVEHVTVLDSRHIAFVGDGDEVRWSTSTGLSLSVVGSAAVYVDNVQILGAVEVDDGALYLDHVDLLTPPQISIPGVAVTGSTSQVFVTNTWIHDISNAPAIQLDGGQAHILYSTLYGDTTALGCGPGQTATIRASLLLAHGDLEPIDCIGVDITYSASEVVYAGVGNQSLGPDQLDWFEGPPLFRLAPDPPVLLGATARWTTGDPPLDIDGRARPAIDGTMTFAGAECPK